MVDEAHSLGVLGATGHGVAEVYGVDPQRVDIWMGTLSKTLVGAGGYVAGSAVMVDFLRSLGGAFVYSVAVPSVIAASAGMALSLMHREPERVEKLQANAKHFAKVAKVRGLDMGTSMETAICPIIVGDSLPAAMLSDRMFKRGVNVQPVLYPGVPPKTSRLRFFLNTAHTFADIDQALDTVVEELAKIDDVIKNIPLNIKA
jgi:8-amino-7-oxononanoate synthase